MFFKNQSNHFSYNSLWKPCFIEFPHARTFPWKQVLAGHSFCLKAFLNEFYPLSVAVFYLNLQGVPKVIVQRIELTARPVIKICSVIFQESSSFEEFNGVSEIDVHFSSEGSFFTSFAPLTCLDHIPLELLLFGLTR